MFIPLNFDKITEHVKKLYDCTRCDTCDRHDGIRMRYSCGHTSCSDCVEINQICLLCLTPPKNTSHKPTIDNPLTLRSKNARNLVNILRDKFNLDVNKRQRLSEQLKLEKEIFPQCIQAPATYFNKRKSSRITFNDKENKFKGEDVSINLDSIEKMENSHKNVEQWINRYIRKPFSELNPNDQRFKDPLKFQKQENFLETSINKSKNRKRPHQGTKNKKDLCKNKEVKKVKVFDETQVGNKKVLNDVQKVNLHDESGIVVDGHDDDEAVIVLDDSDPVTVDKDLNAWLAVHEAENKQISQQNNTKSIENILNKEYDNSCTAQIKTVPFLKKSSLRELCKLCSDDDSQGENDNKDVVITVENSSFITTIKVSKADRSQENVKHSIQVQTDDNEKNISNDSGIEHVTKNVSEKSFSTSEDLFIDDGGIISQINKSEILNNKNGGKHVVIAESDTDEDIQPSFSFEVTADIHRSCDEVDNGVLMDINDLHEHTKRPRRGPRGLTPTSTDSSDKENYNPNRIKTKTNSKKKIKK